MVGLPLLKKVGKLALHWELYIFIPGANNKDTTFVRCSYSISEKVDYRSALVLQYTL